jgi:hypothetical protein
LATGIPANRQGAQKYPAFQAKERYHDFPAMARPIPALKPLMVALALEGHAARRMRLNFSGVDMEMGFNPITLREESPGQFKGQGNLPVCVSGPMRWQATFILEDDQGSLAIPLRFTT